MILVVNQRKAELLAKETIVRQTIIELVVVCGGIAVLVPVKDILFSVEFEEGLDSIVNQGLYKAGPEATIILGIVRQKDRPWGHQRHQMRKVRAVKKICRRLLDVTQIAVMLRFHTRPQ